MTGLFFLHTVGTLCLFLGCVAGICILLFMVYASFSISSGVYLRAFCRKPTSEKLLALTFDDGPHAEYTPQTLDVLNRYGVKAAFFVIGERIAGNEDVLKRIHREKHLIGNHSYTHRNIFPLLGAAKMADDLLQCEQTVQNHTDYHVTWFRPPFGITNPNVAKAVKMRGYRVAGWSIRSLDTVKRNRDKAVLRVIKRLRPGSVILLHDHLPDTPYILEQIIRHAKENGYTFVTVEQLSK